MEIDKSLQSRPYKAQATIKEGQGLTVKAKASILKTKDQTAKTKAKVALYRP